MKLIKNITITYRAQNLIINELEDVDFKISNLSLFIKKALNISKNISYYWSNNNLDIRKRIQDLVFPEKIFLSTEKDKYLTNKLSPIFSLISLIPNTYAYKEKGLLVINYKKSLVVAGSTEISNSLKRDLLEIGALYDYIEDYNKKYADKGENSALNIINYKQLL